MAQTFFSNITLKATPNADLHVLNRAYADLRYMGINQAATDSVLGGVTVASGSGIANNAGAISIDVATTKTLLGLGTAAYVNIAGNTGAATDSGLIPALGADGKLNKAVIPEIAITRVLTANSTDAMCALTGVNVGDVCIVTADGVSTAYMLSVEDGGSQLTDWTKLSVASGVVNSISVNGGAAQDGAVALTFADFWTGTYKVTDLSTDPNDSNASVPSAEAVYDAIAAEDTAIRALRAAKDGTTFGLISVASDAAGLSVTNGVLTTTAASTSAAGVVQLANDYTATGFASDATDAATPKAVADYVAAQLTAIQTTTATFTSENATAGADSWEITIPAGYGDYPSIDLINGGAKVYADISYTTGKVVVTFDAVAASDGAFTAIIRK